MSFEKGISFHKTEVFRNKYVWFAIAACILITMLSYWIIPVRKVLEVTMDGWQDWTIVITASFISLILIQLSKKMNWMI
jgi:Ca2+-transporting ATPase